MKNNSMSSWFVWFLVCYVLLAMAIVFNAPSIAKVLIDGPHSIADMFGWRTLVGGIGSFWTLAWWLGRDPQFDGRKYRKEIEDYRAFRTDSCAKPDICDHEFICDHVFEGKDLLCHKCGLYFPETRRKKS